MLNKEEELRVASLIDIATEAVKNPNFSLDLKPEAVLWIAQKCKELNEEASGYYTSYMKVNRELALLLEEYEN